MSLFDIAERLATEVANMSIDYILEMALEIGRYSTYNPMSKMFETQYYTLWLGSVTTEDNETKAWGIRTDGYIWIGDTLFHIEQFDEAPELEALFEWLERLLNSW